jgi:hypothetical protein
MYNQSLITNPLRGHTSAITSTFTTSELSFEYCCDPLPILQQRATSCLSNSSLHLIPKWVVQLCRRTITISISRCKWRSRHRLINVSFLLKGATTGIISAILCTNPTIVSGAQKYALWPGFTTFHNTVAEKNP